MNIHKLKKNKKIYPIDPEEVSTEKPRDSRVEEIFHVILGVLVVIALTLLLIASNL